MQHSPLTPIRAALRVLAIEWLAIILVLPVLALGLGRLAGVSASDTWHNVILAPHNLLLAPLTLLLAGRVWFGYKYEGQAEYDRRRRERRAA